ncbi:O-antigen ligase family protein [Clostridium perfringens]
MIKYVNFYTILFFLATCIFYTSKYFYFEFLIVFFLILIYLTLSKKKIKYNLDKNMILLIIVYFYIKIISTIFSIITLEKYAYFSELVLQLLVIIVIFKYSKLKGNKAYCIFYKQLAFLGNLLAILGLYECLFKENLFVYFIKDQSIATQIRYTFGTEGYRAFNLFYHPIVYSNFLVCIFWINKFLASYRDNKKRNISYYLIQLIILINIYFTKSRSGWIAISLTILFYLFIKYRKIISLNYKKIICIILGLIILAVIFLVFNEYVISFFNSIISRFNELNNDVGNVSKLQRLYNIEFILKNAILRNPFSFLFGGGLGSASELLKSKDTIISGFAAADNQFLSIIYEQGIISLFIYITIFIKCLLKTIKFENKEYMVSFFIILTNIIFMFFYDTLKWENMFLITFIAMSSFVFQNNLEKRSIR